MGALSVSPEQFESKVNDLRNLFINAHHLLNLYRPHQARESLIMMMEEQLQRSKDEIDQMDKVKAEIESALEQMQVQGRETKSAKAPAEKSSVSNKDSQEAEDARQMWDILDKEIWWKMDTLFFHLQPLLTRNIPYATRIHAIACCS